MDFADKVTRIVNSIPCGRVTTYGTIATLVAVPRGARLVGGILHQKGSKLAWYRVVNRRGFISTNCWDHPKTLQKALLEQEGIEVSADFMINLEKYGWWGEEKYLGYS